VPIWGKMGQKWDTLLEFDPNQRVLSFQVPYVYSKFRQNQLKIATVRARTHRHTDRHTEIRQVIL